MPGLPFLIAPLSRHTGPEPPPETPAMTARLMCSFCSYEFAPPRLANAGGRTVCPRCGEGFVATAAHASDGPPPAAPEPPASSFRPFVAPALIAVTMFVAVFGLGIYAIFNGKTNRGPRDVVLAAEAETPAAVAARRLDRDLGFLPPEVNAVLSLQPGDGPDDLTNSLQNLGVPPKTVTDTLDKIGVKPGQVRSLVVGLTLLPDNPIPRAVVVLSLREIPADTRRILTGFNAQRDPRFAGDPRYKATVNGLPVALRVVDPMTYLLALEARDIDRPPTPGRDHLTAGLRESLAKWPAGATAALAAGPEDWAKLPSVTFAALALKQPDLPVRLAGVRALAASTTDGTTFRVDVRTGDDWVTTTEPGRTLLERVGAKR